MVHRNLTEVEIIRLESQGCICNDWKKIYLTDPVNIFNIRNTVFSGIVSIGSLIDDWNLLEMLLNQQGFITHISMNVKLEIMFISIM